MRPWLLAAAGLPLLAMIHPEGSRSLSPAGPDVVEGLASRAVKLATR